MPRTKGSTNKVSIDKNELERLQQKIYELESSYNTYSEVVSNFVDGFIVEMQKNIKTISLDTLQSWFNNPDEHINDISNLLTYYYIVDGNIFQLYDLIFSLPKLNYKITVYDKNVSSKEKDIAKIKQVIDRKINYKRLTRDLLVQLAHDGSVLGTWLGDSNNPYFYVFSDLEYIFPYGMNQGKMIGVIDLKWLEQMKEIERVIVYNSLKPLVTPEKYEKYKNCTDFKKKEELRYIILPPEKSLVARIHTLNRNQRLGIPFGTQALFDINHKQKLKELERAIADKIIRSIAVLKFKGKDDNDVKVSDTKKREVFNKVKKALEKNDSKKTGITVIGIPDFASFEYPEIKGGDKIFDNTKYETTNLDITNATGVANALTNGTGGNYSSAIQNLNILYQKIAVMLEEIEEIYNQLIVIILGEEKGLNYKFEFDKEVPLSKKEKLDTLMKLEAQGYSVTYILEELGIDPDQFIKQSMYEIENLKLREKILPPQSTYTYVGDNSGQGGKSTDDNPTNESTIKDKTNGGNNKPRVGSE